MTAVDPGTRRPAVAGRRPAVWWTVLRSQRPALLGVAGAVAALAGVLAIVRHLAGQALAGAPMDEVCPSWATPCYDGGTWWWERGQLLPGLTLALLVLPPLSGVVLAATGVARDAERGTDLLLRTQGVTVTRWWVARLLLVVAPTAALFAGLGAVARSTAEIAFVGMVPSFPTWGFTTSGTVLAGYFVLAYGLATAAGVWTRGVAAAVVLGLVGYGALLLVVEMWLRPHYLPPVVTTIPVEQWGTDIQPTPQMPVHPDLTLRYWYDTVDGGTVEEQAVVDHCLPRATADPTWTEQDTTACVAELGIVSQSVEFQPVARLATFTLIETVGATGVGLAAIAAGWWRMRRSSR